MLRRPTGLRLPILRLTRLTRLTRLPLRARLGRPRPLPAGLGLPRRLLAGLGLPRRLRAGFGRPRALLAGLGLPGGLLAGVGGLPFRVVARLLVLAGLGGPGLGGRWRRAAGCGGRPRRRPAGPCRSPGA
ncbi:hypothetical protein [Nonomuraea salmonea]|uniref:hypothetical protein n=1 Tax=Nonomuraea salmonea TaxID=46181 RepID=UPI0031F0BA78